ncbi:MAG: ribokinase [Phycisphaeraceae bacterium]|nr:ribokinase [Phycisphaeraceae bacterium]
MAFLNFGSINLDLVYRVDHVARPGETIAASTCERFAGGKGANQSVALARAGAAVEHVGVVGEDGRWLIDLLGENGVGTTLTRVADGPTGHAIIQVDDAGENAIVLLPGMNHRFDRASIDAALDAAGPGDHVLVQNEINDVAAIIEAAARRGLTVCFNPAPYDDSIASMPLERVDLLFVNEVEGAGLSGCADPDGIADALARRFPRTTVVLTRGADGADYRGSIGALHADAVSVPVVDTTAAGDTFVGFYLAGHAQGRAPGQCLDLARRAAALTVTRPGAMPSIPTAAEVGDSNG